MSYKRKIAIGCSVKYRDLIKETKKKLEELGFIALFPNLEPVKGKEDVELSIEEKEKLLRDHYLAVDEADVVYFICPDGYIGTSCKVELGYALALKKRIYFSEPTNDFGLDCLMEEVIPLDKLENFFAEKECGTCCEYNDDTEDGHGYCDSYEIGTYETKSANDKACNLYSPVED